MSAVLGSVGDPGGLLDPDVESIIEEKNQLISRQYAEIERLQRELTEVIGERDALLCEVSKFKFEREMTDLTRLLDDRYLQHSFIFLFDLWKSFERIFLHAFEIFTRERDQHNDTSLTRLRKDVDAGSVDAVT